MATKNNTQWYFISENNILQEFKRITVTILEAGIREIEAKLLDEQILLHNCRKRIKNIRANLRFMKSGIPEVVFSEYNKRLRDINRKSAAFRDDFVIYTNSALFLKSTNSTHSKEFLNTIIRHVLAEVSAHSGKGIINNLLQEYRYFFIGIAEEIQRWDFTHTSMTETWEGLLEVYCNGIALYRESLKNPSNTNLHDLRKRTKDLYYLFLELTPLQHAYFSKLQKKYKMLSDLLGEIHDHYAFAEYIQRGEFRYSERLAKKLLDRIEQRIQNRQSKCFSLCDELYSVTPAQLFNKLISSPLFSK